MGNPLFSRIYQDIWRPVFTRAFSHGSTETADYDKALRAYLSRPGERLVLDVACGPGNYTGQIADGLTGDGRVIGVDFSSAMLRTALATNRSPRAAYLRADAHVLPFPDNTFDQTLCLAALYLIPDPLPVLDEMVRVAAPGAEIVVFTSAAGPVSSIPGVGLFARIGGFRIFGVDEIIDRLHRNGVRHVEQSLIGEGQYVLGSKPD
ncbi:class I SAM-dependent methyltransferase [Gordonia desulfuricans]|nr:methyltransferase domain-containing protein [Gordonia desulfuricans]